MGQGAILLGGLAVAGTLTATALGPAPGAAASCISAFGMSTSTYCSSTVASVAIAVGPGTIAHADGLLGAAFAFGNGAWAVTARGAVLNLAVTAGIDSVAVANGYASAAITGGRNSSVTAGVVGDFANLAINLVNRQAVTTDSFGRGNVALNIFGGGRVTAIGNLNTALNVGGTDGRVEAIGVFNNATNLLGANNSVRADKPSTASAAFSVFGSNNTVTAGPGPLAVAGSIAQRGQTITKVGPGIHINGLVIGGAAAVAEGAATLPRRTP